MLAGCSHAGPWQFQNETRQRVDRIENSDYRFDALWTDFNGDGCPDAFIFGHSDPATSRLWLNRCDGSATFTYVSNEQSHYFIREPTPLMGAGWMTLLDVNGDGKQDFWLRHANILAARYINGTQPGNHVPIFVRKKEGCDDFCSFGDIDGDGSLDVIRSNRLIERMSDRSVLYPPAGPVGQQFIGDVDGDSWPDIIQPDAGGYWRNRKGSLTWQPAGLRGSTELFAMADFDNRGAMDLITFDGDNDTGAGGAHLYRGDGQGGFTEVTKGSGLDRVRFVRWLTGYGNVIAADFDNDGLSDLLFAGVDSGTSVTLLRNLGGLHFEEVPIDFDRAGHGRDASKARASVGDFDNDGRLDIVKTQDGTNVGIWRNMTDTKGAHWFKARVRGRGMNTDGIGAELSWYRPGSDHLVAHQIVQTNSQHPLTQLHAGLGPNEKIDLVVRFPHDGPSYRYNGLATDQEVVVYADGCLIRNWRPGHGWPLQSPADCARNAPIVASPARRSASVGPHLPCATTPAPSTQRVRLHRNGAAGQTVAVTFGIPFAPSQLTDARRVRILDTTGKELAAHVEPTLRWHFKDGSIRAVRVQARLPLKGDAGSLYFDTSQPRSADAAGWPYEEGLVDGPDGVRVPGVLATLDPDWLSQSLIAGPQQPAARDEAYARYVSTQFEWARTLPAHESSAWLFDRPTTLFKQYVRTGRADYLAAATESYRFYMQHLKRTGLPIHPFCAGGWTFENVKPCDIKYVYIEPILLALGLTGDDSQHDGPLVARMAALWGSGGWSGISGGYTRMDQPFTERVAGLGLIAAVSAYEITGNAVYLENIRDRIGWLQQHQQHNPDGHPPDGSWRHSWQRHEGDTYDPVTDIRGGSPWMSENIIDGLWHAWLATGDERIPPMLTAFGRWLERYGWIDVASYKAKGHDWRDPCAGPDGQIAWYFTSPDATSKQLIELQDSEGWYGDAHTVELALPVALARYFEKDDALRSAYEKRLSRISSAYATECAKGSGTKRRFNWNNRGSGVVQWLVRNFPDAGSKPGSATFSR